MKLPHPAKIRNLSPLLLRVLVTPYFIPKRNVRILTPKRLKTGRRGQKGATPAAQNLWLVEESRLRFKKSDGYKSLSRTHSSILQPLMTLRRLRK